MDSIELTDFAAAFDRARANDRGKAVPIQYSGHLLLPGDDVVISLQVDRDNILNININNQLADKNHPIWALVEDYDLLIRRALRRNLDRDAIRREIVGKWHQNGDEFAFEPYLVRTVYLDKPSALHRYRYRIFPLDGYKLGDDFWVEFDSDDTGEKVKSVFETCTEMNIHYDELPKSMFTWMPVGVVWSPPKKSGYPVLVEYAVGKKRRSEMRKVDAVPSEATAQT
jgi:hypothetical protein